jgi:hypothetical protein
MKNGLGNLAVRDVDQLAAVVKNRLKRIQYRPALIDGFLAQTGDPPAREEKEGTTQVAPKSQVKPAAKFSTGIGTAREYLTPAAAGTCPATSP